ncbi:hypothetical protein FRC00_011372 [Tulasnella sp. 408]|nr:hypothetical protein FRC00_011372 [Tulasnella sp. 408]
MNSSTLPLSSSERQQQQQEEALRELGPFTPLQQSESRGVAGEQRKLAAYNNSPELVESGSSSLPAKPSFPPSTSKPQPQPSVSGPLDFSQVQQPHPLLCLSRTLASARKINDLDSVTYPQGIKTPMEMNRGQTKGGKYGYDRDFLLQFMQICKDEPGNFSNLDGLGIERRPENVSGPSFGSVGRNQRSRMGFMGAPPGGRSASGSIGLPLAGFPGGRGSAPFVMGTFSSTPSRMTSEERFSAANKDWAVRGSGFIRGGAVPLGRSWNEGGAGGPSVVSPSPTKQPRTREQRGRTRNRSLQADALQSSQQEQQQQQAPGGPEQALPVYEPGDRWTPTARRKFFIDENSPEYVERKVRALLNKLTLENFESVSNQIISWANKSENENNAATMTLVIKLIFERAIDEELLSETYAWLCRKMMGQISRKVRDDNDRNQRIAGGHLFRNYLLKRCDDDFERRLSQKESIQVAAALKDADGRSTEDASQANRENGEPVLYSDEYYTLCKIRRQRLGLVRFIAELFKLHMFTERIIHGCMEKLLSQIDNLGEEVESMCKLLATVGQALDTPKAKGHMDTYFMTVQMLAENPNIGWRIRHKLLALLNKLSMENLDSVSGQIIDWANRSENEKNGATLILITELVYKKATDEPHHAEMYARLCRKMMEQISQNVQDDNIRNSAGEPIVGGNLFRKCLLSRCQEDFERGWSQKESAQAAATPMATDGKAAEDVSKANGQNDKPVLYSNEYYALLKAKRQGLGLVRFIGELFKVQMLTERIMHECIKKLLSKIENPEEEELESLCELLTTVGQALDTRKAKGHMDIYFGRIQMLSDNPNVASRIRYMLTDVIELRKRNWQPNNATAGRFTIAQARGQGAKTAALHASKIAPITRGGAQHGGRGQPEQGPDGRNVAGPTPVRAPAKAGDLGKFGRLTASTGPLKTMGPSSVFKKGDRGHDTPPPGSGSSLSRAASGGNTYSLLGGGGADLDAMPKRTPSGRGTTRKASVDQAPQQAPDTPLRKKLALLPRTVSSTNTNEDSAGHEDKLESDEEQAGAATKSYTDKEATAKVEEDVKEFFNIRDVSEGEKSFAELPDEHKSKLIDKLASKALELKESDVKLVADLFERAASKGCPPSAFEDGLSGIIEFLDDMLIDVPQAYSFMARLLRGARLPQETVDSLGDKIFVDGDPLVKPKDKLLRAYNALA